MSAYTITTTAQKPINKFRKNLSLAIQLTQREISGRYKGSFLGVGWSLLTPLFMLTVYTFVFGSIFQGRWGETVQTGSMIEFAIILFGGLIIYQMFSDVITQCPGVVIGHSGFVKKVVFPLEVLPVVTAFTALFHALVAMLVLFAVMLYEFRFIPVTALFIPVVLLPLLLLVIGLAWLFSALGVFFRDLGQILTPIVTACLFLAPIFFPSKALPEWIQPLVLFNPITIPVLEFRRTVIAGDLPDWGLLGIYYCVAITIFFIGYFFFQKTRKGFADVL